jgi:hypothetical protein
MTHHLASTLIISNPAKCHRDARLRVRCHDHGVDRVLVEQQVAGDRAGDAKVEQIAARDETLAGAFEPLEWFFVVCPTPWRIVRRAGALEQAPRRL